MPPTGYPGPWPDAMKLVFRLVQETLEILKAQEPGGYRDDCPICDAILKLMAAELWLPPPEDKEKNS